MAPASAATMSSAECQAAWKKLDSGNTGSVSMAQAQGHVTDFKKVDANGDGKLSSTEFMNGCSQGMVSDTASSGAATGNTGTSSGSGSTSAPSKSAK